MNLSAVSSSASFILSLNKNIIANYTSQLYVTAVGILILPLYIKYMGAEAYGLVGFFTMLQALFSMLDLGLTPTISRETARYHAGVISALDYRKLYRALSILFAIMAVLGGCGLWVLSEGLATHWLNVADLSITEVVLAVEIMAVSVALRWMGGLYRGIIVGAERLVWLSIFNAVIATLRFIAVFFSMWSWGFTPLVFFTHQLVVAIAEVLGLFLMSRRMLPALLEPYQDIGWSFRPIKPLLRFSVTIALTSSAWVLVTQTDKMVLSGIMPLAEYGNFTLAVLVASIVTTITAPISNAIMPRMASLHAEGKHAEIIKVYRNATRLTVVMAGSCAITLAFFAKELIFAWTGDAALSEKVAPMLVLYSIGNGFLAVAAFPYYLQYAKGNLRYHVLGTGILVSALVPSLMIFAKHYGGIGAGYAWLIINFLYLLCWVAYVHSKLAAGLHRSWLLADVIVLILPAIIVAFLIARVDVTSNSRLESFIEFSLVGIVVFIVLVLTKALFTSRVRFGVSP